MILAVAGLAGVIWAAARKRYLIALLILLAGVVAGVIVLGLILSAVSGFYVDILWFREVHFSGVFWSIFWSRLVLGLIFAGVLFVSRYFHDTHLLLGVELILAGLAARAWRTA